MRIRVAGPQPRVRERLGAASHALLGQFGDNAAARQAGPPRASSGEQREAQPARVQVTRSVPKVGRNDPCPCGSGKKYKYCHGS